MCNRKDNWTRFWQDASKKSCSDGVESDSSDINTFWSDCSELLTDADLVLDLCTGKGAVIRELLKCQSSKTEKVSKYIGIDSSNITTADLLKTYEGRVDIIGNTDIEKMPIESNTVDFLTSQYGVEYGFNDKSLREIKRVLKKTGKVYFILHHFESILVKVAEAELEDITYLESKSLFFHYTEELIPIFSKLRNPGNIKKIKKDSKANELKKRYNLESQALLDRSEKSKYPDILLDSLKASQNILQLAHTQGPKEARLNLKEYKHQLADSKFRSSELIQFALTKKQAHDLGNKMQELTNGSLDIKELKSDGYVVAWGLKVT